MRLTPAAQLKELSWEFLQRGCLRKATGRILLELGLHVCLAVAGAVAYFAFDHWLSRAAALVVSAAGCLGVGTNSHTASHYATSRRRWLNELLTYFGYPFFLGLSATFWWHQHVAVHHPAPNVIGVDDDADLSPWFARTANQVAHTRGWRRFYYERLQWMALLILLATNGFNMQKAGWTRLVRALRDGRQRNARHWIDLAALVLHYVCNLVLPALWLGFGPAAGFYLLRTVLLGYGMFCVLAPGHFPGEAVCLDKSPSPADYVLLQTSATINFRTGWIGGFLCSGLQYQIEHHLFPGISHVYYPKVSVRVQEFCRRNGLPYRSYSWDAVLWKCLCTFREPPSSQPEVPRTELAVGRGEIAS